jgi:restriction system protein
MPRKRQSPLEDMIAATARLPWWVAVLLAAVTFFACHWLAKPPVNTVRDVAGLGRFAAAGRVAYLFCFLQFLLPGACLIGAAVSALRNRQRAHLHERAANADTPAVVDDMSWAEFEILVGEAFRKKGFRVTETGLGGADGGVDLAMTRDDERYLVQCKQWRAQKVGVSVVRELYGVMAARGATGGFVVTSGRFTPDATAFATGRNIHLIDGSGLKKMIGGARAAVPIESPPPPLARSSGPARLAAGRAGVACPKCGSPMVERVARTGPAAGQPFWGCAMFPKCRGTRAIESAVA